MKLQIMITAVPSRMHFIKQTKQLLPNAVIEWDNTYAGSWPTFRKALLNIDRSASHICILQDDCIPGANFIDNLTAAITGRENHILVAWSGLEDSDHYQAAIKRQVSWFRKLYGMTGQCIVIPSEHCLKFVRWADRNIPYSPRNCDTKFDIWRVLQKLELWYTVPELVIHKGKQSALNTGNNKAESACFIGFEKRQIDFSKGAEKPLTYKLHYTHIPTYLKKTIPALYDEFMDSVAELEKIYDR